MKTKELYKENIKLAKEIFNKMLPDEKKEYIRLMNSYILYSEDLRGFFDKLSICKSCIKEHKGLTLHFGNKAREKKMCCCSNCENNKGYFKHWEIRNLYVGYLCLKELQKDTKEIYRYKEKLEELNKLFNASFTEDGYWNNGCTLGNIRSRVCQTFTCSYFKSKGNIENGRDLAYLERIFNKYNNKLDDYCLKIQKR